MRGLADRARSLNYAPQLSSRLTELALLSRICTPDVSKSTHLGRQDGVLLSANWRTLNNKLTPPAPNLRTVQQKFTRAWQQKSAPAKQKSAPAKGEQQLESKLTLLYPQLYQIRAPSEKQISTRWEGFDAPDKLGGVCTGRKDIRAPKGRAWDAQEVPRGGV